MKYHLNFVLLFLSAANIAAQDNGFPFGQVTYRELEMKTYERDSSAEAVILDEFGEAHIDDEYNLIFFHHVKIKILKKSGLKYADIEIRLYKNGLQFEKLRTVKASAFIIENSSMREIQLNPKNIFTENRYKNYDFKKFAIPSAREGSVIEFQYELESPFLYKFKNWEFQSDIPKVYSEYWASIPGNFLYNTTLRGYLKLSKNESKLVKDCFRPGGNKADCGLYKYAMQNIPAFVEEDYMTARSNHIAGINFELSEIHHFDGRIDRITSEWKDAEQELRLHQKFGIQLKRGKDIVDDHVEKIIGDEFDPLIKAKKIYAFIKDWYRWDEVYDMFSELGIKKAYDKKTGNVGDINLSLIAALRYAGLDVEPVILSTRANGLPIEIHPVLSDFNYVVAKVNIAGKVYLADATDDFHPFGILPQRCLNGKGRVLGEKESYWIDLRPADRARQLALLTLKLEKDGIMRGVLQITYTGYEAIDQRKKLASFSNLAEYIAKLEAQSDVFEIKNHEIKNVEDLDKPLVEKLEIEIHAFDHPIAENFLFSPFMLSRWKENPFKSKERLYPVDFGVPMEMATILNLEYPAEFEIINLPEKIGLSLPNAGGRFIFEARIDNNRLSFNHSLVISKTVFTAEEYHYLKELFNRIIQAENADLIFKKKA